MRVSVQPSNFVICKNTHKNYREFRVARAIVCLNDPATPVSAIMVELHRPVGPATTAPGGALRDNSHSKNDHNDCLFLHVLEKYGLGIIVRMVLHKEGFFLRGFLMYILMI